MTVLTSAARVVIGGLFLLAAIGKLTTPTEVVIASMHHALSPVFDEIGVSLRQSDRAIGVLALLLVSGEAAIGLALLCSRSSVWRAFAAAALILFMVVLATRFTLPGAPPCGCLGISVHASFQAGVWFDIARNALFAAALILTIVTVHSRSTPQQTVVPSVPSRGAGGFTLIETLVGVAVVTILLAITVPAFLQARVNSRVTRSLSDQRQIVAAIVAYAVSAKESLPFFGSEKGIGGPIEFNGIIFRNGYFRTHMTAWPNLVCRADPSMLAMLKPADRTDVLDQSDPMQHMTLYYMTAAAFADPALFDPQRTPTGQEIQRWLRRMLTTDIVAPDKKGLVIDMAMRGIGDGPASALETSRDITGFADGSAAWLSLPSTSPMPVVLRVVSTAQGRVLTTRDGLRGRDR